MDLLPTSKLRFLNREGETLEAPLEWQPGFLEVEVPKDKWEEVQLWRQGEELPVFLKRLGKKVRVLTDWPRSNSGYYPLRLEYQGEVEEQIVTIWPLKISREAFAQMLEDLDTRLPTSVAIALQRTGALAGLKLPKLGETTLAQELVRLRRAVEGTNNRPGLTEILRLLAHDRHKILKTNEIRVRQEQVRRPSPGGLVQAFSRGHNLDANGRPIRVPDTRVEHTIDVYENQLVKLFFDLVNQRLRRVRYVFEADPKGKLLDEVNSLFAQLKKARQQAAFLDQVSQLKQQPNQITMVLLKRPPYHAALEGYLEFIRSPAVRLEESDLDAPLENLPLLYQVWGTLWVMATLIEVAGQQGYQVEKQCLVGRDKTGIYVRVLPNGQPAVVLTHPQHKTRVKLIPQRSYWNKHDELHSATGRKQIPDVAVEVELSDGSQRVYLFDPKYKLDHKGEPAKEDTDKMQVYREDIRDHEGRRVVRYAAILYPGSFKSYPKAGIDALQAYPGREAELQKHLRRVFTKALNV
jgi:predicted component of viral defense system (DUF524 family)